MERRDRCLFYSLLQPHIICCPHWWEIEEGPSSSLHFSGIQSTHPNIYACHSMKTRQVLLLSLLLVLLPEPGELGPVRNREQCRHYKGACTIIKCPAGFISIGRCSTLSPCCRVLLPG
ncbi:lingual antimicrobial peptide-like [Sceloporus undulatus]|uniref:lingual antimicrobial peptide-like n=1 Tax=Sceloporus undulatus TaxID=8520 RepID=UPI001C4C9977|nr:lingual antimicrobial peptide-like [Sceloporus undulatus]